MKPELNHIHYGDDERGPSHIDLSVLRVPVNVTLLRYRLFENCTSLEEVYLPEGLETIECAVFRNCRFLRRVHFPSTLRSIHSAAFTHCHALEEVTFHSDVHVDSGAFQFCHLKDVHFAVPPTVEQIRDTSLRLAAGLCFFCPDGCLEALPSHAGMRCKVCGHVYSWDDLDALQYIEVTNGVLTAGLGNYDVELHVPDGVTTIAKHAFDDSALCCIHLPDSVTTIEHDAFVWCDWACSVHLPPHLKRIASNTFNGCSVTYMYLPDELEVIDERAFINCDRIQELTIPDDVYHIGQQAFAECTALRKVDLPASLSILGAEAFKNCTALEELTIPKECHHIGHDAFKNCKHLKHLHLPSALCKKLPLSFVGIDPEVTDVTYFTDYGSFSP